MADKKQPALAKALKPAQTKTGKIPWWKSLIGAAGLMIWVGMSIFISQVIVGRILVWLTAIFTSGEVFFSAEAHNTAIDILSQPVWTAIYSALSYLLAMGMIIWVPPKVSVAWSIANDNSKHVGRAAPNALGRDGIGLKGWPTWTDIGLAPLGYIICSLLAWGATILFTLAFPWFDADQAQNVGFSTMLYGADRIWAFISLVVVAPIVEEIIFRGWLYGKLRVKFSGSMGNVAGVILTSLLVSVLFGAVHMQWNIAVDVFVMSLVLCGLREFTGTIYSGILLHMIKNGIAFYILYVIGSGIG